MTFASDICPHCGSVVRAVRAGVPMTALKARMFDAIRRAGPDGISAADLHAITFQDRDTGIAAVKVHISQLNELLEDTGFVIRSRPYRLECRRAKNMEAAA